MKKDLLSIADLTQTEVYELLNTAIRLKAQRKPSQELFGKTLGMIFQKPSTRTAVSFSVAMYELGGNALSMNAQDLQMKRGESLPDTARTLSRFLSGIMIRANRHADVAELARYSAGPVINGLTEKEHPCQVLADLQAIMEAFKLKTPQELKGVKICYVGDGNNVAQSWMLAAGLLGLHLVISAPEGYDPEKEFLGMSQALSAESGGRIIYERNPQAAVAGVHVLYTDVWASMGKEEEQEHRKQVFSPYQLNERLLALADKKAVVMHCLPAHRGLEITDGVIDSPQSIVFDQAEDRLHIQKAILLHYLHRAKK